MQVGVNLVFAKESRDVGHVELYVKKLVRKVQELQSNTRFLFFTTPDNHAYFSEFERVCVERGGGLGWMRGADGALEKALNHNPVEVTLSPLECLQPKAAQPNVLLALDILPFDPADPAAAKKVPAASIKTIKRACAEAKGIIATSQYLRRKFLDLFEVPLDKVTVTPPGTEAELDTPQAPLVSAPYIMLAADRMTKPNIEKIQTLLKTRKSQFPHTLVVIGDARDDVDIEWGPRVIRFEQCPVNVLAALYQHCDLFLYPATRDGSAMRVLESLRAGAPVLTTSSGAIAEFAGNAPLFFNASSSAALLQAMRRMLDHDPEKLKARVNVGKKTAAPFTWEKTAWKVLSALNNAL